MLHESIFPVRSVHADYGARIADESSIYFHLMTIVFLSGFAQLVDYRARRLRSFLLNTARASIFLALVLLTVLTLTHSVSRDESMHAFSSLALHFSSDFDITFFVAAMLRSAENARQYRPASNR